MSRSPVPDALRQGRLAQPLLLVVLAAVGVGVIVLLFDRGLLPVAGIFVAMILGPLVIYLRTWWLVSRHRSLSRQAHSELTELTAALEQERRLPHDRRSSGATDQTLDAAVERARSASSQLSGGNDVAAVDQVESLGRIARPWSPDSSLAHGVGRTLDLAQRLRRSRERVERRRSASGRR